MAIEVLEFTREDKAKLGRGARFYSLDGSSQAAIINQRNQAGLVGFRYNWIEGKLCENEPGGVVGEVAIFPHKPIISGSFYKDDAEQLKLVRRYSNELGLTYAQAIIGTIATLDAVLFAHADATGEWLLPWEAVRSSTVVEEPYLADVGFSEPGSGFLVNGAHRDNHDGILGALCLVVPKNK
ncbi:MAG: hypothetical protein UY06_C0011G0017 [Candidatus Amesbacteria bacterium GW2011_GWA2_47_70]|nr:MAG: hypothetical protein UY06_C0011G0017 [Candidatus Amesbacteria bacterium GW2011_GWA2_47_70]